MTSEPETTKQTAETEFVSPEQESTSWGKAEPRAEPQPEWSTAVDTWGAAWDFHQYGLGTCFGIVGILALVAFLKLFKTNAAARQKKVSLVVLSQIIIFGFSRCVFLCVDAYNSKNYLHITVLDLIRGIGEPCLITAFMLIFLVLRNAIVMKGRFQNWYTTRNIALVTVPYFIFVFASEVIVSFFPSYKGLIFACQIINTLLYFSLAWFYVFISSLIWKKLRLVRKGASKTHTRGQQTLSIFKRCIGAVVGGFGIGAMHVYAMASVHSVFSDAQHVSVWPWFAFQTSMRCLEVGMSVLLYMTGTQNTAGPARNKTDVAPRTLMQSNLEATNAELKNSGIPDASHVDQRCLAQEAALDQKSKQVWVHRVGLGREVNILLVPQGLVGGRAG